MFAKRYGPAWNPTGWGGGGAARYVGGGADGGGVAVVPRSYRSYSPAPARSATTANPAARIPTSASTRTLLMSSSFSVVLRPQGKDTPLPAGNKDAESNIM